MKNIITYLLITSLCFNVYFIIIKINNNKQKQDLESLEWKKNISYKEGYQFFKNKMLKAFPESYNSKNISLICFWDSLHYEIIQQPAMLNLDSMASDLDKNVFEFIFATEMDENIAKEFLARKKIQLRNFKIVGNMDNFISAVFNEKPLKWKDSLKVRLWDPKLFDKKVKPYYLLMNRVGDILYYNYTIWQPSKDTALKNKLEFYSLYKHVNNFD